MGACDVVSVDSAARSRAFHALPDRLYRNDPNWVEVTSDGRFAVVSNTADNAVAIVDISDRRVLSTVRVGRQPKRLVVGACAARMGGGP